MSLVETLHREHKARLARIASRSIEKPKPVPRIVVKAPEPKKKPKSAPVLEPLDYKLAEQGGPVRIERILKVVCSHFDMTAVALLSARRTGNLIFPRHVLYYLCKQLTLNSLPSIGRRLGGRDHTTVLHGVRKIEREMETDPHLREMLAKLTGLIGGTDQTRKRCARVRLTPEQVREIRASDEPSSILCKRYGVTHGAIWHILKRNTWKDVE